MSEKEMCVCGNPVTLVKDIEKGWKVVCSICGRQSETYTKREYAVKAWNSVMKTMRRIEA